MKLKDVIEKNKKAILERHQTKSAVENPPEVQEFMEALDLAIVSQSDDSRLVESDGFHPSSLGIKSGKCQRRNVYLLRGTPREPITNPRTQRIFGNGHAVHDRLQKYLEKMDGINFQTEVVIEYENPPIRGHADGVFEWDGKKILLEIKSCNQDVFDNRVMFKKPKDEHVAQANLYAHILGLDYVWIMYENKNTQELLVFELPTNATKAKNIIKKWGRTYELFKEGLLPERPYKEISDECQWCDMHKVCYADEDDGVDFKTGEPVAIRNARVAEEEMF